MNKLEPLLNSLGLCKRAGKITKGDLLLKNIKHCHLLVVASDASDKTKERWIKKAYFYKLPLIQTLTSQQISKAINSSHTVALGVVDPHLAQLVLSKCEKEDIYDEKK